MIHPHGYWLDQQKGGHYFDRTLATSLVPLFTNHRVIDFGCGEGRYVAFFRVRDINCCGYDGNPETPVLSKHQGQVLDLAQPVSLKPADYVLSLEVGEHIPREFEQTFLDNIANHCTKGAVVSWAVPKQQGRGHFNCRSNSYIIGQMQLRGMSYDHETTQQLRQEATLPWFHKTLMLFNCS